MEDKKIAVDEKVQEIASLAHMKQAHLKSDSKAKESFDEPPAVTHILPEQHIRDIDDFPRWLKVNLWLANATVVLMFFVAIVDLCFGEVLRNDLKHE